MSFQIVAVSGCFESRGNLYCLELEEVKIVLDGPIEGHIEVGFHGIIVKGVEHKRLTLNGSKITGLEPAGLDRFWTTSCKRPWKPYYRVVTPLLDARLLDE